MVDFSIHWTSLLVLFGVSVVLFLHTYPYSYYISNSHAHSIANGTFVKPGPQQEPAFPNVEDGKMEGLGKRVGGTPSTISQMRMVIPAMSFSCP